MMRTCGVGAVFLVAVLLSACGILEPNQRTQRSGVVPGETVTVQGNQNIYAIAQEHGVSMRDIIILNNLHEPFALKSGQSLVLPYKRGETSVEAAGPAVSGTMPSASATPIESQELPPPLPAKQTSSNNKAALAPIALAPVESLNAPVSASPKQVTTTMAATHATEAAVTDAPKMVWPVQGPLLSGFGPKGQGVNNDGVNIGAPKGSPVVAAAGGNVVYAGNEMKGFGNLVLIRHEGGWVTAYAYLDRVLVAKDAVVAQGDMIGTVGKTGNVSSPQLHFETRHDGKAVDPSGLVK